MRPDSAREPEPADYLERLEAKIAAADARKDATTRRMLEADRTREVRRRLKEDIRNPPGCVGPWWECPCEECEARRED